MQGDSASNMIEYYGNMNGMTALISASLLGNTLAVKRLLRAKAHPNTKNNYNRSALHFAVAKGHRLIVDLLLDAGAEVNEVDSTGMSAAALARKSGYTVIERILVARGGGSAGNKLCCCARVAVSGASREIVDTEA